MKIYMPAAFVTTLERIRVVQPDLADHLSAMFALVNPHQLDPVRSSVSSENDHVLIAHQTRREWDIHVLVSSDEVRVEVAGAHEHFFRSDPNAQSSRPWTMEAVDFIAELLHGEVEIRRHYRGRFLTKVAHQNSLGTQVTVCLTPAAFLFFLPRRVTRTRPNYECAQAGDGPPGPRWRL